MYNNVLYNVTKYTAYSKKLFGEDFQSSSFTVQFPRNSYVETVNCETFGLKSLETAHSLKSQIIKQHQQQVSIQNAIVMQLVLPFLPVMLVLSVLLVMPILRGSNNFIFFTISPHQGLHASSCLEIQTYLKIRYVVGK